MTGIPARLAAASGAFYVVVIIVGGEIIDGDGPLARVGYGLVVLSFAAFVVFLAFLHRILRDAEGPGGWVAGLAFAAGLLHSAVRFDAQAPRMVGAYRDDLTPEVARTLVDLNGMAFVTTGLLLGLYAAAAGWVCLAHRVLPRWLGWFGFVSGVLAVGTAAIGMADPDSYVPLPFLGGLIWTLIASVVLTVRPLPLVHGSASLAGSAAPAR
jgi:hypothetical protein